MRDYHVILSVTNGGEQLNHLPLEQYRRVLREVPQESINRVTMTIPRIERDGTRYETAPIEMNLESFKNGRGFSNADIRRWLEDKGWIDAILLFCVSFSNGTLDYTLVGRVETEY